MKVLRLILKLLKIGQLDGYPADDIFNANETDFFYLLRLF